MRDAFSRYRTCSFTYKGFEVEEFLVPWEKGYRLVWALVPVEKYALDDGRGNPCFYVYFEKLDQQIVYYARRRVCEKFYEYHFPSCAKDFAGNAAGDQAIDPKQGPLFIDLGECPGCDRIVRRSMLSGVCERCHAKGITWGSIKFGRLRLLALRRRILRWMFWTLARPWLWL